MIQDLLNHGKIGAVDCQPGCGSASEFVNPHIVQADPIGDDAPGMLDVGEGVPTGGKKKIMGDETDTPYMEIGKCSPF